MNTVAYFEIQADDPRKLVEFYTAVFDWKFENDPAIPVEYFRIFNAGPFGGLLKRPAKTPSEQQGTNAFVCSVQVENFDKTAKKIVDNGGKVALEKFAVVGKCWQGYFIDPQGNTFGVFEVDEHAK